jgi:CshA-type fibril repeat protein
MPPTWTTMNPTGTTMNPTGTTMAPTGTTMNPTGTTMAPTGTTMAPGGTTASPNPVVMNMMQTVKRASAFTIDFNDIARRFASLNLNAASVLLVGANNAGVTSLTVANQGTFAVSTATSGVVNFTPVSGFTGFPSPVRFTIANTASARSAPFQYTFLGVVVPTAMPVTVHEDLPKIDFDARSPVAGQQPPDIAEGFAKVTVIVVGTLAMPGSARPGGLAIDPNSVEIVGPVSNDGSMPSFSFVPPTAKKKLVVDGEGTWTVTSGGNIEFSSAKNFVRWPTPIGYTVKDTDGNLSNPALISINPELKKLQDGINNFLTKTDDAFWAEFDMEVIKNANITNDGDGLKQIRLIVHTLWATINASFNTTQKTTIYGVPRYLEHDYQQMKAKWVTAKLSKAGLLTATDEVTNTLTLLGSIPLATRMIRLEVIRRLITDVFPPSAT